MRQPDFYAAVFGIIRNEKWEILFSRRSNTWHLDGYLSLPAGHVESGESVTKAMIREFEEEIGIIATKLHVLVSQQSINIDDWMTYFNAFFEVESYTGIISNNEIDKCSELIFLSLDAIKDEKVVPYVLQALESIRDGIVFSEIRWNVDHDS